MLFNYKTIKVTLNPKNKSMSVLLNRPDEGNAINQDMVFELESVFNWPSKHIEINSILLSSTSDYFCSGFDKSELYQMDEKSLTTLLKRLQKIIYGMHYLPQTIVCDLKCGCAGVGIELTLGSDLRIGHKDILLQFNFLKEGLPPTCGGIGLLFSIVGQGHVRNWTLGANSIDGAHLQQTGFLNDIYNTMNEKALFLLDSINSQAPITRIQTKRSLLESIRPELDRSFEYESRFAFAALQSHDWRKSLEGDSSPPREDYLPPAKLADFLKDNKNLN